MGSLTINEIQIVVEDRNAGDEVVVEIKKEWLWVTEPGTAGEAYQKGLKDGRIKGRQEKSYEVAAKMIAAGITTQKISDLTGLSIAQIDAL